MQGRIVLVQAGVPRGRPGAAAHTASRVGRSLDPVAYIPGCGRVVPELRGGYAEIHRTLGYGNRKRVPG